MITSTEALITFYMNKICFILLFLAFILLWGFKKSVIIAPTTKNLCEVIKHYTPKLTTYTFNPNDHPNVQYKNLHLVDSSLFQKLFLEKMFNTDSSYLFGYFLVSKTRLGLVCYNKTIECDHKIDFFSLHIIDSCSNIVSMNYISSEDHHGSVFIRNSEITKDCKTLSITLKSTSEWIEENSPNDTLFTDTFVFNLSKVKNDTASKARKFEVIKRNVN